MKVKAKLNEADHSMDMEKVTMMSKTKQTGEAQKTIEKITASKLHGAMGGAAVLRPYFLCGML